MYLIVSRIDAVKRLHKTLFQLQDNIDEDEELNENASPFLNTPASEAASHAANILKELGYENIAIYPGGKYHTTISNVV